MRLEPLVFVSLFLACVDERHVMVRDATTSPERRFVCFGGEKAKPAPPCTDATEDLPGNDNGDDTVVIAMPYQCKGRVNEVYVRNAHSKKPTVLVRCATNETSATPLPARDGGP